MKIAEFAKNPLKYSYKYRPSAFYFWNEDMEEDRIESMLAQMEKDQIREVLFHPVHGLTIPYLSDKFCTIYKKGLSLDRKNPYKDYTPENCQWVSSKEQNSKLVKVITIKKRKIYIYIKIKKILILAIIINIIKKIQKT